MIFEPVIPWGWLGVAAAACLVLFCFLLARGTRSFRPRTRMLVSAAYLAGIAGTLFLLANPGRKETLTVHSRPVWIVALDASSSMKAPMQSSGAGGSRVDAARRDLKSIAGLVPDGVDVRWVSVKDSSSILPDAGALARVEADGSSSPCPAPWPLCWRTNAPEGAPLPALSFFPTAGTRSPRIWEGWHGRPGIWEFRSIPCATERSGRPPA